MIRVERSREFWSRILLDQTIRHLLNFTPEEILDYLDNPLVTPLASDNGGFLFVRVGSTDFVQEFHTIFLPQGWGREVNQAAKQAANYMFNHDTKLLLTYEDKANRLSQPPKSFGFKTVRCDDKELQLWFLSLEDWLASPAYRRISCLLDC